MNLATFTSFEGRISRREFWHGFLVLLIITILFQYFLNFIFGVSIVAALESSDATEYNKGVHEVIFRGGLVSTLLFVLTLWPFLAIYTKRCHDRNKSGWWSLFLFAPIFGIIWMMIQPSYWPALVLSISLFGSIWLLIELGFLRGTGGSNRFGDNPISD